MGVKKRVQKKYFVKKEVVEEIISPATRVLNFFSRNLKQSIAVLGILIIILISFFAWRIYGSSLDNKAQVIFADAFNHYSLAVEKGNQVEYQLTVDRLNDLISKYPQTSISKKAFLYLGNCYFFLKDYNNALRYYTLFLDKASKKDILLLKFVYEGLGYASEQIGKYDQAVEYFKKSIEEGANFNDSGLMNLARAYEELKQNEKAVEIYQRIIKDYPQSEYRTAANDKIFALKTNPVKK